MDGAFWIRTHLPLLGDRMKYRHKTTGAIIDVKSVMSGAWEPIGAPQKPDVEKKEDAPAQEKKRLKK